MSQDALLEDTRRYLLSGVDQMAVILTISNPFYKGPYTYLTFKNVYFHILIQ